MNIVPNWFDLLVLALLILGIVRGRKLGMSGELLPLLQWAAIVVVGAYAHDPLGRQLKGVLAISLGWSKLVAYVAIALVIMAVTGALKKKMGEKLVSQDLFGKGEFYLGMMAGAVHHALILVAVLALLNSVSYSKAQMETARKKAVENLGSDFFGWAHPARIQSAAFKESVLGPKVTIYIGHLFISPNRPAQVAASETLGQKTSRQLNEIMGH
jgi:uncharacterized membrane protein required for colicin V production